MNIILIFTITGIGIFLIYILLKYKRQNEGNEYDRSESTYQKNESQKTKKSFFSFLHTKKEKQYVAKRQGLFARMFSPSIPFDDTAVTWCANFLLVDKELLTKILKDNDTYYSHFKLAKRSGGHRTISAPQSDLLSIQRTIYKRILLPVNIHPSSMGFRQNLSVVDNAKVHLQSKQLLKIDILDFFGSIKKERVTKAFKNLGYPSNISDVLAHLCTLEGKLPQGAATSPNLSNIISYGMDIKLSALAKKYNLVYTRYADDITFSGEVILFDIMYARINDIVRQEKFIIQRKKTRFLTENKRKIITGISVSSGTKLTIPKAKKRDIRKQVHYILTKGLAEHQRFVGSEDPSYLKRLIGYLSFWHMVEPNNEYVINSLSALKKL